MNWKTLVNEIKKKTSLIDEMQKAGIRLIPEGNGRYSCLCPFHVEKQPSCKIYEDTDSFYCFGCNEAGDLISFLSKKENLTRGQVILALCDRLGIPYDKEEEPNDYRNAMEAVKYADSFFKQCYKRLPNNHKIKQNVIERNLDPDADWYGYAPKDTSLMVKYLEKKGISQEVMENAGLLNRKGGCFFFDRLMFTFHNYIGEPIAFSGRDVDFVKDKSLAKYINSKSSMVFKKSDLLFNMYRAKRQANKENKIYVCEGYFDVIAMYERGYHNVVCVAGTAFTDEHAKRLIQMTDDGKIVFIFDGDSVGKKTTLKVFRDQPLLHSNASVIFLPKGMDPCDYLQKHDKLPEEESLLASLFEVFENKVKTLSPEEKVRLSRMAYKEFTDYIENDLIRREYEKKIEGFCGVKPPKNKKKNKNKAKDKEEAPTLLKALSFYYKNRSLLKDVDESYFPESARHFFNELKEKSIIEEFDNEKQIIRIMTLEVPLMTTELSAKSHLDYLLRQVKKEQQKRARKANILKNSSI